MSAIDAAGLDPFDTEILSEDDEGTLGIQARRAMLWSGAGYTVRIHGIECSEPGHCDDYLCLSDCDCVPITLEPDIGWDN